jgi:excisionase family DNA binding protein
MSSILELRTRNFFAIIQMEDGDVRNLTIREASERMGLSEQRVRRLAKEGRFPNAFRFGNAWSIPEESISLVGVLPRGWPKGKPRGKKQEVTE